MIARIQKAVERLRACPLIGRRGKMADTRELVVKRTPYIVVDEAEPSQIIIHRVLHTSEERQPEDV